MYETLLNSYISSIKILAHLSLLLPMLLISNLNHSIEKHLWENVEATWSPIFRETEIRRFITWGKGLSHVELLHGSSDWRLESLDPVISISWSYSDIDQRSSSIQLRYQHTYPVLLVFHFCISKCMASPPSRVALLLKTILSELTSQNSSGKLIEADRILKVKIKSSIPPRMLH